MQMVRVSPEGVIEVLSPFHWWCRRCGRWTVCDDEDLCAECSWMVGAEDSVEAKVRPR